MNDEDAYFLLGEKFRWSLLGDDDGEENDEDSIVNDLDYYLSNYEHRYDGVTSQTPFEHWGWEQMRRVVRVQRITPALTRELSELFAQNPDLAIVPLPVDTALETAIWFVQAIMKKHVPVGSA